MRRRGACGRLWSVVRRLWSVCPVATVMCASAAPAGPWRSSAVGRVRAHGVASRVARAPAWAPVVCLPGGHTVSPASAAPARRKPKRSEQRPAAGGGRNSPARTMALVKVRGSSRPGRLEGTQSRNKTLDSSITYWSSQVMGESSYAVSE